MNKIGQLNIHGEKVDIMQTQYRDGRPCLQLMCDEGPYATFSVNVPTIGLEPGQVAVKTWSENESLREPMLATGLFKDTGIRIPCGFSDAEIWTMTRH